MRLSSPKSRARRYGREKRAKMEVVPLKIKYPQGAEKQLIKAILNREVRAGACLRCGCVVQTWNRLRRLRSGGEGEALIERVLTVSGDA